MVRDSKDFLLSEIPPDIKREMTTAFEVPLAAAQGGREDRHSGKRAVRHETCGRGTDDGEVGNIANGKLQ